MNALEELPFTVAACRALEACSEEWVERGGRGVALQVELMDGGEVRFSPGGLCFANYWTFLRAVTRGFAWPRIAPLLMRPMKTFRVIRTLRGLAGAFLDSKDLHTRVALGLRGGLAAAEAFARLEPKCVEALARECPGTMVFTVAGEDLTVWFRIGLDAQYQSGSGDPPDVPAARVCFRDLEVACRAVDGQLDSLAAPALGEVSVSGRIPLAEAVGYVADMAARNLVFAR